MHIFLEWQKKMAFATQGSNSVLEGRCPAEFSSNLPQHTCMKFLYLVRAWLAASGVFD